MQYKSFIWAVGAISFSISLAIYWITLAPTMLHIDCGELATAQAILGIAHATGYPLFTLLGHLFLKVPMFDRAIVQLNFLSALWTSMGIGLLTSWFMFLIQNISLFQWKKGKNKTNIELSVSYHSAMVALAAGITLAFQRTIWAQATSVEVYSLHVLMLSLCLWSISLAWIKQKLSYWILASVALGFAFSNHLTTILIIPFFGWFYFIQKGISNKSLISLGGLIAFTTLVVAAFYAYLPLRAAQNPILNWGNIHNWETFKWHITGGQFQVWMFSSSKVAGKNLGNFLKTLPADWGIVALPIMFFGVRFLRNQAPVLLWGIFIGLFTTIFYSINYDIKDLEPYFLLAILMLSTFLLFGMLQLLNFFRFNSIAKSTFILVIPVIVGFYNYSYSDQSKATFFEDYTKSLMENVPKNSLVISQQWDFFITPFYYLKYVENQFPGSVIVDKELLRRSWYFRQLNIFDPAILKGTENQVERFLTLIEPFEKKEPYDANSLQSTYVEIITSIIANNVKTRSVFLTQELAGELNQGDLVLPKGYQVVPKGWLLQVIPESNEYASATLPNLAIKFPKNWKGYYSDFMVSSWNQACNIRSAYETKFGKTTEANQWIMATQKLQKVK